MESQSRLRYVSPVPRIMISYRSNWISVRLLPDPPPACGYPKTVRPLDWKHICQGIAEVGQSENWIPGLRTDKEHIHKWPGQRDQKILAHGSLFTDGEYTLIPLDADSLDAYAQPDRRDNMAAFVKDHRN